MLLLLGVITLVSGGLEQTIAVVARKIDAIGERINHLEQATRRQTLHGPHFSTEKDASQATHKRSHVES